MSESPSTPVTLDRLNLRLPGDVFTAIDAARLARPGHVSRNTWLTEAVQEKLAREGWTVSEAVERRHG